MARFNSRWVAAVFYGAVGAVAAWYARSVLSAGRFRDYLNGHGHVVTSDREPFWYWVWITLFLGIALYCLVRALRALSEIIQVRSMDRSLEERERLRGEAGARPGTEVVNLGKSVTVKIVGEDGQEREYHSMDEVPPEIRSQLEALEAEMMKEKHEGELRSHHARPVRRTFPCTRSLTSRGSSGLIIRSRKCHRSFARQLSRRRRT